jgi:outer membrane protein
MIGPGLVLLAALAPSDSVWALSLEEAVRLALRNAPRAVQAAGQVSAADAGVRSAYAAFLPSVSLSAGATRQLPSAGGGTRVENGQVITLPDQPWSTSGSLGASVLLFGGGRRLFQVGQAKQQAAAARADQVTARFATRLSVQQSFFDVLAARESQSAARAQIDQADQQLRMAVLKVRAKTATRSDSLRSEIQLRNARLALMTADNALAVANAGLSRLVGVGRPVTAAEDSQTTALALGEEALRRLAAEGPGVRSARAGLAAAKASRLEGWSGYLPSLNASYSRGANGVGPDLGLGDSYSYSGALRLSLSLPLFDQLQREEGVVRARVAVDDAQASLRDAELAAVEGLEQSLGAFQLAEQRVSAGMASVEAAEEDLRVQQQRYAVGGSTLLDVLTSQTLLDQARQDLIRARYDQRVAKAQIEALVGQAL